MLVQRDVYLRPVPDEGIERGGWVLLRPVIAFTDGRAGRPKVCHLADNDHGQLLDNTMQVQKELNTVAELRAKLASSP